MNAHHLVKMVNEISAFWEGEAGPEKAAAAVAGHLKRYWDPRMRRQIIEHYHGGAGGLCDTGRAGVGILAEQSATPPAPPTPA